MLMLITSLSQTVLLENSGLKSLTRESNTHFGWAC